MSRAQKQAGLKARRALSPKNIVDLSMAESQRVQHRNKSIQTNVLKTSREYIGRIVAVNPTKE